VRGWNGATPMVSGVDPSIRATWKIGQLILSCQGCHMESWAVSGVSMDHAFVLAERDGWQVVPVALCPECRRKVVDGEE